MTDEDKLRKAVVRATRAKALLEDELLKEAFEELEKRLIEAWIATDAKAAIDRENAFRMIHANRKVRDLLAIVVSNGSVADAEIKKALREQERRLKAVA